MKASKMMSLFVVPSFLAAPVGAAVIIDHAGNADPETESPAWAYAP